MDPYYEMYLKLASGYEKAITAMAGATMTLIEARQEAEDILLRSDDDSDHEGTILTLLPQDDPAEQR